MFKRMGGGGGVQRLFVQCLKKLHFPCRMASLSEKISKVMMEKNLRLNEDKCVVITIGTKKREKTKIQLKTNPNMCGKSEMKHAEKEKWLGQQISARGLSESVAETVAAKEGKIKAACIEVDNIVNNWRTEIVGGAETAMISWEACIILSRTRAAPGLKYQERLKQTEQSSKVVCEAHFSGATKHTCACPHLGNWSDRHKAKNMERKVDAYPSRKKPGRDCLGKQNLQ